MAAIGLLLLSACAAPRGPRPVPDIHTLLPGSRVSLAVPPGFRHDPSLPGFESPDEFTAIFASEIPGSVYSTLRSFSAESFQKNGMELHGQERVTVDGWPGRLYRASQSARNTVLERLVLVFGDSSTSVILNAVTPRESWADLAATLREALLSVRWHRDGVGPG